MSPHRVSLPPSWSSEMLTSAAPPRLPPHPPRASAARREVAQGRRGAAHQTTTPASFAQRNGSLRKATLRAKVNRLDVVLKMVDDDTDVCPRLALYVPWAANQTGQMIAATLAVCLLVNGVDDDDGFARSVSNTPGLPEHAQRVCVSANEVGGARAARRAALDAAARAVPRTSSPAPWRCA